MRCTFAPNHWHFSNKDMCPFKMGALVGKVPFGGRKSVSTSLLSCQHGGRDTSPEGWYLAESQEAMLGDEIAHNTAVNLFPGMEGTFMSEYLSD